MNQDITDFLEKVQSVFLEAKDDVAKSGHVFKNNGNKLENLAFWLYTGLCELDLIARQLIEAQEDSADEP